MKCPIHPGYLPYGEECPLCNANNLAVHQVELDKIDRARDTAECQGAVLDHRRSFAVLVFEKPRSAAVNGAVMSATNVQIKVSLKLNHARVIEINEVYPIDLAARHWSKFFDQSVDPAGFVNKILSGEKVEARAEMYEVTFKATKEEVL